MNSNKSILEWIEKIVIQLNAPADFSSLQIAFATAFPLANDLPAWTWPEY